MTSQIIDKIYCRLCLFKILQILEFRSQTLGVESGRADRIYNIRYIFTILKTVERFTLKLNVVKFEDVFMAFKKKCFKVLLTIFVYFW